MLSQQQTMDWYTVNRERILQKKRERYIADPMHAEKKRKQALERYHRLKTNLHTFSNAIIKDGQGRHSKTMGEEPRSESAT